MMLHVANDSTETHLTEIKDADIQPNAVDIKIDRVFAINTTKFVISEQLKEHRGAVEIMPDSAGWWYLNPGTYEVYAKNVIKVGATEAGWVIPRSTLNRNGVFLTTGLYDSKYNGPMAVVMHITTGPIEIQQGTRIGQYLCFKAEAIGEYNGSYGFDSNGNLKETNNILD